LTPANLPLISFATLLFAWAMTTAPVEARTEPGELPGLASTSVRGDTSSFEAEPLSNWTPTLLPPKAKPAFRGLFVLVMPWAVDRHLIEARRRLQFALRLDEPQEPAFNLTLRF
jgi:hypothetical protein